MLDTSIDHITSSCLVRLLTILPPLVVIGMELDTSIDHITSSCWVRLHRPYYLLLLWLEGGWIRL